MGEVWFTSDTHFGHRKVAELRGFKTAEDHDAELIERWNTVVKPGDQVWHLGDVAGGPYTATRNERVLETVRQLNGEKHLIAGNHDAVHPMYRDAHRHQRQWLGAFASLQPFARRRICGYPVSLSHLPYWGDHTSEERHFAYRLRRFIKAPTLLCGHVHDAWRTSRTPEGTLQINAGVDVWDLTPVSLWAIAETIEKENN